LFESMSVESGRVTLNFSHADSGLGAPGGALRGFELAGADTNFFPATAEIIGKHVIVSNQAVPNPVAVRYGWAGMPDGNLLNGAGLPASPFRARCSLSPVQPD
ncbi:MAG: hypothetical protein PHR35_19550, partial [Kiritimatiellae bacterium]|nr:hypothetical protein [Kiritimatiellia bacterium]